MKRFGAGKMVIELRICSFQNPFSCFFSFFNRVLENTALFTLMASFIKEKHKDEAYFPNIFHFTPSAPNHVDSGSKCQVSGGIMQKADNSFMM